MARGRGRVRRQVAGAQGAPQQRAPALMAHPPAERPMRNRPTRQPALLPPQPPARPSTHQLVQLPVLLPRLEQQLGQPLRRPGGALERSQVAAQPRDHGVERLAVLQCGARGADLLIDARRCR